MTTTADTLQMWNANPADLDDMLNRAASDVSRGTDVDDATSYLLGAHLGLDDEYAGKVNDALNLLVMARMHEFITVVCLLDEAEDASYAVVNEMAHLLRTAIEFQGNQYSALAELVKSELERRAQRQS